jgi:hypothetical protein
MPVVTDVVKMAREAHEEATQKLFAASNASHPLRTQNSPEALHRDARYAFQNMGQTLIPELLRELDEARKLLAQRPISKPWDEQEMQAIIRLARENGWNGIENSKLLSVFLRNLIEGLSELTHKPKSVAEHALDILRNWWGDGNELRYAEVSRGRKASVMVTLWKIGSDGHDVKLGHGEGETLEEAVQRAKGVIIL